jgi:hypothetical protein
MITVDYMVPTDAAIEANGKHYLHGAGWNIIAAQSFPVGQPLIALAILLRVPWNDATTPHTIGIDIHDADGQSILPNPPGPIGGTFTVGHPATAERNDILVPLVFNMVGVTFSKPGDYPILMSIDGAEVNRFPLHLRQLPQGSVQIGR